MVAKVKKTDEQKAIAKIYGLIRSALRRAFLRWPSRTEALRKARHNYMGPNTRQKWEYLCTNCQCRFPQKEVCVDHIIPCGTFLQPSDWTTFGPNLFCDVDGLQVLCKLCHKAKTQAERKHESINKEDDT